jgi:hypothetical protein
MDSSNTCSSSEIIHNNLFNPLCDSSGNIITEFRKSDNYVNLTKMCQSAGKKFKHYYENQQTKDFIKELCSVVGIPTTELVDIIRGGIPNLQGTWADPLIAINCAQWCSPSIGVLVAKTFYRYSTGQITTEESQNIIKSIEKQMENKAKKGILYNIKLKYNILTL